MHLRTPLCQRHLHPSAGDCDCLGRWTQIVCSLKIYHDLRRGRISLLCCASKPPVERMGRCAQRASVHHPLHGSRTTSPHRQLVHDARHQRRHLRAKFPRVCADCRELRASLLHKGYQEVRYRAPAPAAFSLGCHTSSQCDGKTPDSSTERSPRSQSSTDR